MYVIYIFFPSPSTILLVTCPCYRRPRRSGRKAPLWAQPRAPGRGSRVRGPDAAAQCSPAALHSAARYCAPAGRHRAGPWPSDRSRCSLGLCGHLWLLGGRSHDFAPGLGGFSKVFLVLPPLFISPPSGSPVQICYCRAACSDSTWPVLDALIENPEILPLGKNNYKRENIKHDRRKASAGWVLQVDPAVFPVFLRCCRCTVYRVPLMKANFQMSLIPVSWTSVPEHWNRRYNQEFWEVDRRLQG